MKNFYIFLVCLGMFVVLLLIAYFPLGTVYKVAFDFIEFAYGLTNQESAINSFRFRLTLISLLIAATLILLMWLLRKASLYLDLVFFEKALTIGMFYIGITTVLMITGLWLDFKYVSYGPLQGGFARIGFLFYYNYI